MNRAPRAPLLLVAAMLLLSPAVAAEPAVTVLVHHPNDGVDPFGFAYAGSDYFTAHYFPLVAEKGRFDYPFFLADGVVPIEQIPDTAKPFASARQAYGDAVHSRATEEAPAALNLSSSWTGPLLAVTVATTPRTTFPGESLHLWLAITEDHVHYQPPPGLTNGVTDHRFTVRAVTDLGALDLANGTAVTSSWQASVPDSWQRDRLEVAAWLQQDALTPRFDAHEVVQATHAPAGQSVAQSEKGVLVEMLSATWCEPCLYGDLALEDLAVSYGVADRVVARPAAHYFEAPSNPTLVALASLALGVGIVALTRRRGAS